MERTTGLDLEGARREARRLAKKWGTAFEVVGHRCGDGWQENNHFVNQVSEYGERVLWPRFLQIDPSLAVRETIG